jgi:hypothetical protein
MPVSSPFRRARSAARTTGTLLLDEDGDGMNLLEDESDLDILSAHDPLGQEPLDHNEIHSLEPEPPQGDEEQQLAMRVLHDTSEINLRGGGPISDPEDDAHADAAHDQQLDVRMRPLRKRGTMRA